MSSKNNSANDDTKESDELIELQNENSQLNLELCTLSTQCENYELENKSLKEEIAKLKDKIKYYEEYVDKIEENDILESTTLNEIDILSNSTIQDEKDINVLKHKVIELQKEIVRLNDNIKEELINKEKMQSNYEEQLEVYKNDVTVLENENDKLREEIDKAKDDYQNDLNNYLEEIGIIKHEKELSENKCIEKL